MPILTPKRPITTLQVIITYALATLIFISITQYAHAQTQPQTQNPPPTEQQQNQLFISIFEPVPPGESIDIDGKAESSVSIPSPSEGGVLQKFINRVLSPTIYAPSARFRGAVEMIIDAILTRNVERNAINQITKESLSFALPTSPGETTQIIAPAHFIQKLGREAATIILLISLLTTALSLIATLMTGNSLPIKPFWSWLLIALFALSAHIIVYTANALINELTWKVCPQTTCLNTDTFLSFLFPQQNLDLIPDLTRIIAIALFVLGILVSFLARWLLLNIVVWIAPIAIASLTLPTATVVLQYWLTAYGRLAITYWATIAIFIIANHATKIVGSSPTLNLALALAFATILIAINTSASWKALIAVKDVVLSSAGGVATAIATTAQSFARAPAALAQSSLNAMKNSLALPATLTPASWSIYRKAPSRRRVLFSPIIIEEGPPSYIAKGYFMEKASNPDQKTTLYAHFAPALLLLALAFSIASSAQAQSPQPQAFTQAPLNVRAAPTITAPIHATLPCATPISFSPSQDPQWLAISSPVQGFVAAAFVATTPPETCPRTLVAYPKTPRIPFTQQPDQAPLETLSLPCSQPLIIYESSQQPPWVQIVFPVKGFTQPDAITSTPNCPTLEYFTIASSLNVRSHPTTTSPILARLPCATKVTLTARTPDNRWGLISTPITGFVALRWLAASPDPCFVPNRPFFIADVHAPTFRLLPTFTEPPLWSSPDTMRITLTGRTPDGWLQAFILGRYLYIEPGKMVTISHASNPTHSP